MVSSLLTGSLDHQCTARFCGLEPRLAEQPHSKYRKALSVILLPFSCLQRMLIFLRSLHLRSPLGLQSLQHLSSPTMGRSIWFTQKLQVTINLLHTSTSASRKATCCQKASVQQRKRQICGKVKENPVRLFLIHQELNYSAPFVIIQRSALLNLQQIHQSLCAHEHTFASGWVGFFF